MPRRALWGSLLVGSALVLTGCLDPLYGEATQAYGVCCPKSHLNTCPCGSLQSCSFGVLFCAQGQCVPAPGGVPSGSCGGSDSGTPADAGTSDAGQQSDGGIPTDAGQADGGSSQDSGTPIDAGATLQYGACCAGGMVNTCLCPDGICGPFTPCANGTCVAGASGVCP